MSKFDEQYLDLCERILKNGERVVNYATTDKRKDSGAKNNIPDHAAQGALQSATIRLPHQILQFDLSEEFPILTTKFVAFKTAVIRRPNLKGMEIREHPYILYKPRLPKKVSINKFNF